MFPYILYSILSVLGLYFFSYEKDFSKKSFRDICCFISNYLSKNLNPVASVASLFEMQRYNFFHSEITIDKLFFHFFIFNTISAVNQLEKFYPHTATPRFFTTFFFFLPSFLPAFYKHVKNIWKDFEPYTAFFTSFYPLFQPRFLSFLPPFFLL